MADPREGKVLQGRYRILSLLAEGGMGVVYKGERVGIGRAVVIKFLHAVLSDKPGIVDRFEREARATARLNHPHCVALVDFGIDEGAPYLVMEYVEGKTLADLLDHGAVPTERAVEIARQILAGLEHAHERGILHRDLKPANVMIIDAEGYPGDFVKLLDFGLAKLAWPGEDKRDVTVEGIAIGTPGYMSPEQAAGVPSDRRSDIYCTGALLYHLVTGNKAFEGDDVRSVLRRHREETPASPRALKPGAGISKPLEDVLFRAMQRDQAKRYQTAHEMAQALLATPEAQRRHDAGASPPRLPGSASPTPAPDADATRAEGPSSRNRGRKPSRSTWLLVGVLVGSVAAVAAVAYSPLGDYLHPRDDARLPQPPAQTGAGKRTEATRVVTRPPMAPMVAPPSATDLAPPAVAATPPVVAATPPAVAATPPDAAVKEAVATAKDGGTAVASDDDDDDDTPAKSDDGSNENDRAPPPEPAAAPHDAPSIRSVGDARALIKKGNFDGALAGLFRLRRARPTPSASKSSEIATLIGDLYFERKWWTDGLREYRFAITLDGRARRASSLVDNSVHALADRSTYSRARRLILDYVGRSATSALKRAARSGSPPTLRRRAQKLLATLESKSYRLRR
ncbi:MAG: serine/threonine protein kinase [Myxococcales bacterium]|nr:serine/threonine protein kinase [Myxococcales bacterium]